ncbi:MAG: efflux RND transporter permease subunit, partial [Saprospiraceae bacterium]|nr:efflux RND transporter permease subunit [Saprospiraceae bacterium]
MFSSIIRFSLRHKLLVLAGALVIMAWGLYSFSRLPIDAIPDITNNQVQVLTVCPTLATQEVEQFVTSPIELEVRNIPGVVELRSISRFGLSVITIVFDEDIGTYQARQMVNEKLAMAEQV